MHLNLKIQKTLLLISFVFSGALGASIPPSVLAFDEGEQFNLTVSGINFNRIFIEGEKITKLSYPEKTFVVDKSEMEQPDIKEGSIYLKPVLELPVTLFLTTDKGHHVSLNLKPDEGIGKTLRLVAKTQTKMKFMRATVSDVTEVDEVMAAMKAGETPKDFNAEHTFSRPFYVKKDIKVLLEKHYKGARMTGYVYRLENKSNHEIALSTEFIFASLGSITCTE